MTAISRKSVLGLAVLLAAATAAADTVITAEEVVFRRRVEWAGPDSIRLTPPGLRTGILSTRDVCEIRLSDSSRAAELAARLPGVRVAWHADVLDTLAANASPVEMAARCRDMYAALRECGWSDATVPRLLNEIGREDDAQSELWPRVGKVFLYGTGGALLGGLIGGVIGEAIEPTQELGYPGGGCVGGPVGCAVGAVIGLSIGSSGSEAYLMRMHRSRVNDLVRCVNLAVAAAP